MDYGIPPILLYLYQQVFRDLNQERNNPLLEKGKTKNIIRMEVFRKNESRLRFVTINL
jgi:hypothetical protein